MTLEQLKLIRDSYMVEAERPDGRKSTRGEYMKLSLDGGIDLVTSKDLVVFDDDNEIAHAVCINEDMRSQASFPVKIISSEYAMIQQVECIMSQKNFEDFLNEGFLAGTISAEKKGAMIKWTRNIRNQAQQPLEAEPYFDTNPKVIPMADSVIKRDDAKDKETSDDTDNTENIVENEVVEEDVIEPSQDEKTTTEDENIVE